MVLLSFYRFTTSLSRMTGHMGGRKLYLTNGLLSLFNFLDLLVSQNHSPPLLKNLVVAVIHFQTSGGYHRLSAG
jgi:hypothetical protein